MDKLGKRLRNFVTRDPEGEVDCQYISRPSDVKRIMHVGRSNSQEELRFTVDPIKQTEMDPVIEGMLKVVDSAKRKSKCSQELEENSRAESFSGLKRCKQLSKSNLTSEQNCGKLHHTKRFTW